MKRVVIAAPHSGSGKTTVTLGIMAALKRRGLALAPFKVGPDFIDPGYHRVATGVDSINLDGWMSPPEFVRETFALHAANADMAVIEGVMGLFDGIDGSSDAGSTAEIAKLLDAPVLLVVDARSQARSAAALVHGFASFDRALTLAGVIFNNVASPNHERLLREAMAHSCQGVAVLGCLPKDPALSIPSRHLGLLTAEENPLPEAFLAHLAETMERNLDLDALVAISAGSPESLEGGTASGVQESGAACTGRGQEEVHASPVRIAVARDAAFCFTYPDNLRLLREQGAEITFFSPLTDAKLPDGISGVYLPGGYPEMFAATLAANDSMKESLRQAVESGLPLYAECGGFIYLTRGVAIEEVAHPFVGIFPVQTRMLPRRKALGYREIKLLADGLIGEEGSIARGHEFHYSEMEEMPSGVDRLYSVSRKGSTLGREGFRYRNCLASYIHLHFSSCPDIPATFVRHCRAYTEGSLG